MMNKDILRFCLCTLLAIFVIPSILFAASFDCAKAKTKTEKAVCSDPGISQLDDDLAVAYGNALKTDDRDEIKKSQRRWLKETLAPCINDKECIKKAYENRLLQLNDNAKSSKGTTTSNTKPPECLQCGAWQISGSGADGLEGQILTINNKQIIIPNCGVFDYSIKELKVSSRNPILIMLLQQRKGSFLCPEKEGDTWTLDMEISGHMKENSIAEFNLRKGQSTKPTLWLYCWNMEREDPCESGSGIGSSVCSSIQRALIYKALSDQVASAFRMLGNMKVKKLPSFNTAQFNETVLQFCIESEKNSGFDAWPMAHAYECQSGILQQKYDEFTSWDLCMNNKNNKLSACKFPSESFDRSQKREEE